MVFHLKPKAVETFWLLSLNIICAFLYTTKFTQDAKKKVKCQELLVLIFTILQLSSCSSLPSWCNPALAQS